MSDKKIKKLSILVLSVFVFFYPILASADIEIVLKKTFIENYKDRVTITAPFVIDKSHDRPNPPKNDGDLHIAGRSNDVKLPIVAEIMNAKFFKNAVDMVKKKRGTGTQIQLAGAWRLWCEHEGDDLQEQGMNFTIENSNPPHVFEIHPVAKLGNINLLDSLVPIDGYEYKDAEKAFTRYENVRCHLSEDAQKGTVKIDTVAAFYNYVEFKIELNETPYKVEDGCFVFCKVLDLGGELINYKTRMAFVKDSPAEIKVRNMKKGETLRVIGIPRICLKLVSWRVEHAKERPEVLGWNLPYEMIVVGVVED
jgi:hypothetical protein